jgi:hypothetical protein
MFSSRESEDFLRVVTYPRNKREAFLAATLQLLGTKATERIAGDLPAVTPQDISAYAVANFNSLDRYPNPKDQLISDHEIVEALGNSLDRKEQAILVAMWMRFEEIKDAHQDSTGMELVYDTQLSFMDLQLYGRSYDAAQNQEAARAFAQNAMAQQQGVLAQQQNAAALSPATQQLSSATQQLSSALQQPATNVLAQQQTERTTSESGPEKVTLHTIYGENIISNYFD